MDVLRERRDVRRSRGCGWLRSRRWGRTCRNRPAAAAIGAVALSAMAPKLLAMTWRFEHPDLQRAIVLGILGLGVCGSALASVFSWRHARSNLGTLKYVRG